MAPVSMMVSQLVTDSVISERPNSAMCSRVVKPTVFVLSKNSKGRWLVLPR